MGEEKVLYVSETSTWFLMAIEVRRYDRISRYCKSIDLPIGDFLLEALKIGLAEMEVCHGLR